MKAPSMKCYWYLAPFSWLYGLGIGMRNRLFDWKILSAREFDLPIISVGNLTVGGTGKTPHTEYLIRLLQDQHKVALLSRGYKRKSKGFRLASPESTPQELGDEPYQIWKKFPHIFVAVDVDRCHGIDTLCNNQQTACTEVVLLDDAYQHRKVIPGIHILLVDYNRPISEDALLPVGHLREPAKEKVRAQVVIVTKCPSNIKPMDFRIVTKQLKLCPYQRLYFSTMRYGNLQPVFFPSNAPIPLEKLTTDTSLLVVTGIANPVPLLDELKKYTSQLVHLRFEDHHNFSKADLQTIEKQFNELGGIHKLILTTEKDAARLLGLPFLSEELKPSIYQLPIEVVFLQQQQEDFNNYITDYVRKNSRDRILPQRKDAHKA